MEGVEPRHSDSGRLPAEIWLEIFEQVPKSTDLYGASVTCRMFRDLTARAIHRDLVWIIPEHVNNDFRFWDENNGVELMVRSLVLGLNRGSIGGSSLAVSRDIRPVRRARHLSARNPPENPDDLHASDLYDIFWQRIRTFTNLSSLTMTNMFIYSSHFELLHSLHNLRTLALEWCVFQGGPATSFDNRTLPITELTMLNVRRGNSAMEGDDHWNHGGGLMPMQHVQQHQAHQMAVHAHLQGIHHILHGPPDALSHVLSLATASNLRKLTIDSSADVFSRVYTSHSAQDRGWTVPGSLEEIYVIRKRTCVGEDTKAPPPYPSETTFPDTHLYQVCGQAPQLKVVSTPVFVPTQVTIVPEMIPLALERFTAPLESAQIIACVRNVQALGLLRCGVLAREGVMALTNIAAMRPGLKMLMMECKGWDTEIVSAISRHFKQLRRLKVVYDGPGPNEDYLVGLAPDHLSEMPELHTLELYQLPLKGSFTPDYPKILFDQTFSSLEDELRDIIIPWQRFCPKLRRVQLVGGYVMTRAFSGAVWKIETVSRLDSVEDLVY